MSTIQTMDCSSTTTVKLTRVNYFDRQLLTADDMTTERDYFLQKLRRHNRFLHGWGVVCGLPVAAVPAAASPWRVQVGSGYALGPYGDEIFVGEAVYFDLAACISGGSTSPCEPNLVTAGGTGTSSTAYLAIKYAECLARPVQVVSSGCGCNNDPCQYSRIVDSFQIQCLAQLPDQPPAPSVTLCQANSGKIAPCPPCPTNPWVVLAKIVLPSASNMNIADSAIDTTIRRILVGTAVLQDQVVACCCKPTPPPPPPPPAVTLKSIQVRTSAIAGTTGGLLNTPSEPAGAWTLTPPPLNLGIESGQFDFELVLSGKTSADFPVKVTAQATLGATVKLTSTSCVVAAGQTDSQAYVNNSVSVPSAVENETSTITLTATATDNPSNSVTATLTLTVPQTPK